MPPPSQATRAAPSLGGRWRAVDVAALGNIVTRPSAATGGRPIADAIVVAARRR